MAGKRKASPKAAQQHGERKRKRRVAASANRDPTYLPTPSPSPSLSQASTIAQLSDSNGPSRILRSSTVPSPDSIYAAMVQRAHTLPRRWSGESLNVDLVSQISYLETVASSESFLIFRNVAEITSTLKTARERLDRDGSGHDVPLDLFERAKALFEAQKAKYIQNLGQILFNLAGQTTPQYRLSYDDHINWYSEVDTILYNTHDYAYDHGFKAKWNKAATSSWTKFNEGIRKLQLQGDVDEHWNPTTMQSSTEEKPINPPAEPPCPMDLLQGPRSPTKINDVLDHLIAYYKRQTVKATRTETSAIFLDLYVIKLCISTLFSDSKDLEMTLEEIVGSEKLQAYHAWHLRFEAVWATPAISVIQQKFQDLKKATHGQPLGRAELILFEFSNDLDCLAMEWDCPENASREEWEYLAPKFVSNPSVWKAAHDLEEEYLAFQDDAYAGAELSRLWLLVWRTLKRVEFPLPEEPEEVSSLGKGSEMSQLDPFAIERAFFESEGQPSSNQVSLSTFAQTGDVSNPRWIEGFVSKYCEHVARCHLQKEKYYWQFSTLVPKQVPTIVENTLQASNQQPIPHPDWNKLLHRVVLRLNHLLGDQKLLKRWWRDEKSQTLTYLDVGKSSTGIVERGAVQSTAGGVTTNRGRNEQGSVGDASDRPTGRSTLRGLTGGAAGNGGQDGEGSGDGNGGDRHNQGRNSESSASSRKTSKDSNQEDQTPPESTLPVPTTTDLEAFVRESTPPRSPQTPPLRRASDEAAAGDDYIPFDPVSSSVGSDSTHENIIRSVGAGPLAARVHTSALPWVQYPIGETRAVERAQSLQIAREMRERGIATSGPHVEDVQNIVPAQFRLAGNPEDDVFSDGKIHSHPVNDVCIAVE